MSVKGSKSRRGYTVAILVAALAVSAAGALPPNPVNYQGVLRDASDAPLDGTYDMEFAFWSLGVGGDQILIDRHTAAFGGPVTVSGGLFSVSLGEGSILDGSGPNTYLNLGDVFRDYASVWLAVRIAGEDLSPRIQVTAAAYALNASNLDGRTPSAFLDTSATPQTKVGTLFVNSTSPASFGVSAGGIAGGGYFSDLDEGSYGAVGSGPYGVEGFGTTAGGHFRTPFGSGEAHLGLADRGIEAYGNAVGGYFEVTGLGSGRLRAAEGDWGLNASGKAGGGFFWDSTLYGSALAYVATNGKGIQAQGASEGGHFFSSGGTAVYASSTGAFGLFSTGAATGVESIGTSAGGHFLDADGTSEVYLGFGDYGVLGYGQTYGAYFEDTDHSGVAYVGYGDRGIWGKGLFTGGTFSHPDEVTFWADVSRPTYKITGTGSVAFVQNDPRNPEHVLVYNAPEGDEVATYTRGSARLVDGVARVPLEETFALVTNPDVGLTAHLTPRGEAVPLAVESLRTGELVVRGPEGAGAAFDYLVFGLRIGFEEEAVVQVKDREALPPGPEAFASRRPEEPAARAVTPLERFTRMAADLRGVTRGEIDHGGAAALRAAIEASGAHDIGRIDPAAARAAHGLPTPRPPAEPAGGGSADAPAGTPRASLMPPASPARIRDQVPAPDGDAAEAFLPPGLARLPVSEPVEAGDLLVLDTDHPGRLRRAAETADPNVVGVAAGPSDQAEGTGRVLVVGAGFTELCVDAGFGEVRAGDLLVSSPTAGCAMRTLEALPGTVIGKALEPLEAGTGTVRVLVMPR